MRLDASEDRLYRLEDACEARADQLDLTSGGWTCPSFTCCSGSRSCRIAVVRPLGAGTTVSAWSSTCGGASADSST